MPPQKRQFGIPSALRTGHEKIQQLTATGRQMNETNVEFLKIDVETALIFTQLALTSENRDKVNRNRRSARKAYDTILRLRRHVTFTPSQEGYMVEMMSRLKNELELLGEKF
jgi:hypothetical protein